MDTDGTRFAVDDERQAVLSWMDCDSIPSTTVTNLSQPTRVTVGKFCYRRLFWGDPNATATTATLTTQRSIDLSPAPQTFHGPILAGNRSRIGTRGLFFAIVGRN